MAPPQRRQVNRWWRLQTESELNVEKAKFLVLRLTNLSNLLNTAFSSAQRFIFVVVSSKELHQYRYDGMMNEPGSDQYNL